MKSINTLIIKSLTVNPIPDMDTLKFESELQTKIEFICAVTGKCFHEIIMNSNATSRSPIEANRKCIENYINKLFSFDSRPCAVHSKSEMHNKIDHIYIQLPEPYKSLFEELFDVSSWEIPDLKLID